jgi:hypothetical protein
MNNYSLSTLLRIRTHNKTLAETGLREAFYLLASEKQKLTQIEMRLKDTISARVQMQNDFFLKASSAPCNQREVFVHISRRQKNIFDENILRKSLHDQKDSVEQAGLVIEKAKTNLLEASRNLKAIEIHFLAWQQQIKHAEEIKQDYETDDHNGIRFIKNKER